jgi:hypothetical protein
MDGMRKIIQRGVLLSLTGVFALSVWAPVSVFAHDGEDPEEATTNSTESEHEEEHSGSTLKDALKARREERKQEGRARLDAAKQRVCEVHKKRIAAIMKRGAARAENHVAVFTKIAERTKAFYEKKGKVLANYDELVAAVDSAKAKTEADIATLKTLDELDCSSEDPKGNVEDFKTALKTVKDDLQAYRTAIKNLIVGVKSVQSAEGEQ